MKDWHLSENNVATPDNVGDATQENSKVSSPVATVEVATPGFLPDLTSYTHSISEASELMKNQNCKYHSERKIQRLCQSEAIDCYRLKTTRKGQPVTEWIVNGASLFEHIKTKETKIEIGDATVTPNEVGDASGDRQTATSVEKYGDAISKLATPDNVGDARIENKNIEYVEEEPDATVTPNEVGDASGDRSADVQILIEKAELRAKLEAQEVVITDLREDKSYLRKELKIERDDKRALQRDMKELTERSIQVSEKSLSTIQNIALKGVLDDNQNPPPNGKGVPIHIPTTETEPPKKITDVVEEKDFTI